MSIPLHACILIQAASGRPPPYRARERAPSLAKEPALGWGPACSNVALQGWSSQVNTFFHLLDRHDVDGAWTLLAMAARRFLAARQGSAATLRPDGINYGFAKQAFSPHVGREGEAFTQALSAQQRVIRLAEGALKLWPLASPEAPPSSFWRRREARAAAGLIPECP